MLVTARRLRKFHSDTRGNVAIVFGLSVLGILGLTGLAIDYSRIQAQNAVMQSVTDQIALSLANEASSLSQAQTDAKATRLMQAALAGTGISGTSISAQLSTGTPKRFLVSTKGNIKGTLSRVFGVDQLPLNAKAEVNLASRAIEIALVLDNTGSMNGSGKLSELKTAAKSLISTVQASASGATSAKISVVPFAKAVKIGVEYFGATWLDWSDFNGASNSWKGCVDDRNQPNDVTNNKPGNDPFTWFPASNCGLEKLMPLTDNWAALTNKIDALTASGSTNLTIGVAWGLNMLTPGFPLSTASNATEPPTRFMLVLTDGVNTANKWTNDSVQIDARTKQACDNAKAAGVKIFAVRVVNGNETLLKDCASEASMYYNLTDASQLKGAFDQITQQLMSTFYLGK